MPEPSGRGATIDSVAAPRSDLQRQLVGLLDDPREDMAVEIKDWLDLSDKAVAADFARELLALANHGGGTILFGFEDKPTGCVPSGSCPFPAQLYSQDAINNLCKRHAEPAFHCTVHSLTSAAGNAHVVVEVPGGHRVPIRAKRDGPEGSRLRRNAYYVRRPGPESAPIETAQEWDTLLRRCIGAQREELLDSFRAIVNALGAGATDVLGLVGAAAPQDPLTEWRDKSRARLDQLIAEELPGEIPSRYTPGTFSAAYRIIDADVEPDVPELMKLIEQAKGRETGWPVWGVFNRDELRPRPAGRVIECWLKDTVFGDGAHSDFWRVSTEGQAYLLRGYQEDSAQGVAPKTTLDLTLPVWRTGECLLHAARMAQLFGGAQIEFSMQWDGLKGRHLSTLASPDRYIGGSYTCHEDRVSSSIVTSTDELPDALPEVVRRLAEPLYTSFDFFRPPAEMYSQELGKMKRPV
jgi:hypothetical protein